MTVSHALKHHPIADDVRAPGRNHRDLAQLAVESGDTKTKKSRRTLALPQRCVEALRLHRQRQSAESEAAGAAWKENGLVFAGLVGTVMDASHVRRSFRHVTKAAGLDPASLTPREPRHSFVSLLSDGGVPLEDIADLCGHAGISVTEKGLPPPAARERRDAARTELVALAA